MSIHQLDTDAINHYLDANANSIGKITASKKFSGGQSNPTFLLTTTQGEYVLRRQPPGKLLKSAHAVDREYRVIKALQSSAVPVPAVHHLCRDTDVIGSMFYIMEYVKGEIFWDAALKKVADNQVRARMYDNMNQVLADLHDIDIAAAGLDDFGRPGNYFSRQVERWTAQYRASETTTQPAMESLIDYLNQNIPADDGQVALVHGDFRLDNMIFTPDAEIKAILDWELSTLGHPYADLAYQCMQLRLPANLPQAPGLGGLNRNELGIPDEKEYVARYCERRGIDHIENWPFYLAFSFFRLAAIIQGVVKRAQEGNASSDKAQELGAMVGPLADMAMKIVNKE
ncbi:phosphotransferase family protein [Salinimonas chungwhensis]|uniref:phosphotransferase family protein n=1 Tax=Salinimonas chungwhensis TaxID=265425 RepID=UPI0003750AED|nr:phosphotransferase family protein [Salinimonas chungwhensis]